jgi:hypothetical protein
MMTEPTPHTLIFHTIDNDLWIETDNACVRLDIGASNGGILPRLTASNWTPGETPESLSQGVGWHFSVS